MISKKVDITRTNKTNYQGRGTTSKRSEVINNNKSLIIVINFTHTYLQQAQSDSSPLLFMFFCVDTVEHKPRPHTLVSLAKLTDLAFIFSTGWLTRQSIIISIPISSPPMRYPHPFGEERTFSQISYLSLYYSMFFVISGFYYLYFYFYLIILFLY